MLMDMESKKRIVVDIDNTLWDFASVFVHYLKDINPDIPEPSQWDNWEFWKEYVPEKSFRKAIKEVHLKQDTFHPYEGARHFLTSLEDRGFFIIIASHRDTEAFEATLTWLNKYGLSFHDIHLSYNKSVLFDSSFALVDDSPVELSRASDSGIMRTGLLHPWNEKEDHPLFFDLRDVLTYIDNHLSTLSLHERELT